VLEPRGDAKEKNSFRLFIYDCDADKDFRRGADSIGVNELFPEQARFIEFLEEQGKTINEIWLFGNDQGDLNGRSLPLTSAWLINFLQRWREWPWGADDLMSEHRAVLVRLEEDETVDDASVKSEEMFR
jgi:hypothetical protein